MAGSDQRGYRVNAPTGLNVYRRLNAARQAFHSLQLKKSGHNKFAGYYYFELGDFLIPALTVFAEHGLCANVSFSADIAHMTIRNVDDPADALVITSPMGSAALKGCHEVQNIGAVETYQRRYLWVAALEIVEHDALDATTGAKDKEPIKGTITPTTGLWEALDEENKAFLTDISMEAISLLTEGRVEDAVAYIKSQKLDADDSAAIWTRFDSKQRSAMKKAAKPTVEDFASTP